MRYQICKSLEPLDPRNLALHSLDAFLAVAPAVVDCELEAEAVITVRQLLPDGAGMPVPVKMGSGTTWMLGFVQDGRKRYNEDSSIPFVLFVRALPERERDKVLISKMAHFDRSKWKAPVHRAVRERQVQHVEVRGTDLEDTILTDATIGRLADGRLVITADVAGIEVSFAFDDKRLALVERPETSQPADTLPSNDLASVGSSFDPNPY